MLKFTVVGILKLSKIMKNFNKLENNTTPSTAKNRYIERNYL